MWSRCWLLFKKKPNSRRKKMSFQKNTVVMLHWFVDLCSTTPALESIKAMDHPLSSWSYSCQEIKNLIKNSKNKTLYKKCKLTFKTLNVLQACEWKLRPCARLVFWWSTLYKTEKPFRAKAAPKGHFLSDNSNKYHATKELNMMTLWKIKCSQRTIISAETARLNWRSLKMSPITYSPILTS